MVQDVYELISEYAKMISSYETADVKGPKIILKSGSRCYMTVTGADFSDLKLADIQDVTAGDPKRMPAAAALMASDRISAMILATPPYASICLESRHELTASLDDMAQIAGRKIEIIEPEAKRIARALSKASAVMIENACLISSGRNLFEAFNCMEIVEKSAEITLKAQVVGGVKPISGFHAANMRRVYLNKYSRQETEYRKDFETGNAGAGGAAMLDIIQKAPEETAADSRETELREKLVELGNRLVREGLVQGTWGNLSVRLDDTYMLVTPSGIDYERLGPDDMVKVRIKDLKAAGGGKPTSEKSLHAAIYRKYKEAGAVVHTHSKNCSIFAAAEMPLQVEDMGMIAKLGEIVKVTKYASAGTNQLARNAVAAMKDAPGCILSHHGMVCCGKDLDDAFDTAVEIEEAAGMYIDKRWDQ